MMKAWYIKGYTQNGEVYCRDCVAETLEDESYRDPYTSDAHDDFKPIFASDEIEDEFYCEYCFESIGE